MLGRYDAMRLNIGMAASACRRHGADGLILTAWGDNGHHQPWPLILPGLVFASYEMRFGQTLSDDDLSEAIARDVIGYQHKEIASVLCDIGKLERDLTLYNPDESRHHTFIFGSDERLADLNSRLKRGELADLIARADGCRRRLLSHIPEPREVEVERIVSELVLALDFVIWGARRMMLIQARRQPDALRAQLHGMIGRYEAQWIERNRIGGLSESAGVLRAIFNDMCPMPKVSSPSTSG
jgi:hypothetical protein